MMPRLLQVLMILPMMGIARNAVGQECEGYPSGTETTIAIYTDLEGTQCTGTFTNGILTGSIWVNLAGAAAGGITGAEFSNVYDYSYYPNFEFVYQPTPGASLVIGNPFRGGTNIAFDSCQTGPRVRLGTFLILAPEDGFSHLLGIGPHESPSNYVFCCPLVTLCDGPVFTKVCATGLSVHPDRHDANPYRFFCNSPGDDPDHHALCNWDEGYYATINSAGSSTAGRCPSLTVTSPTGVTEATWSTVKSLYR